MDFTCNGHHFAIKKSLKFRWNNTPLSESIRFRQPRIAQYLKEFIKNNPNQGSMDDYDPEENDYN